MYNIFTHHVGLHRLKRPEVDNSLVTRTTHEKTKKKNSFLGEITHLEKDSQINSILFNYERHNGKKNCTQVKSAKNLQFGPDKK